VRKREGEGEGAGFERNELPAPGSVALGRWGAKERKEEEIHEHLSLQR
jgi:hypothetical protein